MAIEAKPGNTIKVTVTMTPRNESAAKTLSRVFGGSAEARKLRDVRARVRTSKMWQHQRGGRPWTVRPKAPRLYQPKTGDACEVFATTALIRDLESVSRWVDVTAI